MRRFILGSDFRSEVEHDIPWNGKNAINFIENHNIDDPFFMYVSYFGPHQPYAAPTPYNDEFKDVILPENFSAEMDDSPIFDALCRSMKDKIKVSLKSDEDYKQMIQAYYGQLKMIDNSIGEIISKLKDKNLYDDTAIIFTSDHGDYLGSYGLFFKGQMYDASSKVPFIIKAPSSKTSYSVTEPIKLNGSL